MIAGGEQDRAVGHDGCGDGGQGVGEAEAGRFEDGGRITELVGDSLRPWRTDQLRRFVSLGSRPIARLRPLTG